VEPTERQPSKSVHNNTRSNTEEVGGTGGPKNVDVLSCFGSSWLSDATKVSALLKSSVVRSGDVIKHTDKTSRVGMPPSKKPG
jgi:hypothetical protein